MSMNDIRTVWQWVGTDLECFLIPRHSFYQHLSAEDSYIPISGPELFPESQIYKYIFNCLWCQCLRYPPLTQNRHVTIWTMSFSLKPALLPTFSVLLKALTNHPAAQARNQGAPLVYFFIFQYNSIMWILTSNISSLPLLCNHCLHKHSCLLFSELLGWPSSCFPCLLS